MLHGGQVSVSTDTNVVLLAKSKMQPAKEIISFLLFVALCWCGGTATHSANRTDPEMLQYLEDAFQRAKHLNRPMVNGEVNLLPQGKKGFSNTIRCFFDGAMPSRRSGRNRILTFNLSSLSSTDEIQAVQLVLKQQNSTRTPYTMRLFEIIVGKSVKNIQLLDSGEYHGQWHVIDVLKFVDSKDLMSGNRNYQLALRLTNKNGSKNGLQRILRSLKPMLVVYTNDLNRMAQFSRPENTGRRENAKRSLDKFSFKKKMRGKRSAPTSSQSLQEKAKAPCMVHVTPPSVDVVVSLYGVFSDLISPAALNFTYCHGTCNSPTRLDLRHLYTNHATLLALYSTPELANAGPCCVPDATDTIPVTLQYTFNTLASVIQFPVVQSCRCL